MPSNRVAATLALIAKTVPDIVDPDATDFETPSNVTGPFSSLQRT